MKRALSLYFRICSVAIGMSLSSCVGNAEKNQVKEGRVAKETEDKGLEERVLSFWDDFDFMDTLAVKTPEIGEQRLVDFISLLPAISPEIRATAIKHMLSKAKAHPVSFQYFKEQYERYLYNPNSPQRNDSSYESVLEFLMDSIQLNTAERFRYGKLLKLVRNNQVGGQAIDFDVELSDGQKTNLHQVQAPLTFLLFYEPGCSYCEYSILRLRESLALQSLVSAGRIQVIAVYASGNREIWKDYQDNIPESWMNAFDFENQILDNELYDLKASPTLYLLDQEKRVVVKDGEVEELLSLFNERFTKEV